MKETEININVSLLHTKADETTSDNIDYFYRAI